MARDLLRCSGFGQFLNDLVTFPFITGNNFWHTTLRIDDRCPKIVINRAAFTPEHQATLLGNRGYLG